MKELPDDRTSGVVVCLLVVHARSVIGRWTSTGLWSTHRPWARVWNVLKVRNGSSSSVCRQETPRLSLCRDDSSASSSRNGCMFHERGVHRERGPDGPIAILMKM